MDDLVLEDSAFRYGRVFMEQSKASMPQTPEPRSRRNCASPARTCSSLVILLLLLTCGILYALQNLIGNDTSLINESLVVKEPPCGTWEATTGPGLAGYESRFQAVAAPSLRDAWAVGFRYDSLKPPFFSYDTQRVQLGGKKPLIARWEGTRWEVSTPSGVPGGSSLNGIAAISSDDIWTVGISGENTSSVMASSLAMHWDGEDWEVVRSPNPGRYNVLNGVAALSSSDVWAVGNYLDSDNNQKSKPLVLHLDGKDWSVNHNLNIDTDTKDSQLSDVVALSSDDVWAVGYHEADRSGQGDIIHQVLVLHWDGTTWSTMPVSEAVVRASDESSELVDITAVSQNDIWAIGKGGDRVPIAIHWNGSAWVNTGNPFPDIFVNIEAIAAISHNNVWAVGGHMTGGTPARISHWDGKQWTEVISPEPVLGQVFRDVARVSENEILAVGGSLGRDDIPHYALAARFIASPCSTPSATTSK